MAREVLQIFWPDNSGADGYVDSIPVSLWSRDGKTSDQSHTMRKGRKTLDAICNVKVEGAHVDLIYKKDTKKIRAKALFQAL